MGFKFWKRKPYRPRGPDGKFIVSDGTQGGATVGSARGTSADIHAVADTLKGAFSLVNTIQDHAIQDMQRRSQFRDMLDDIEGSQESSEGPDFEQMAAQVILSQLANQNPSQPNNGDPWSQGVFYPGPPPNSPSDANSGTDPGIPSPKEGAGGVERLNQVLAGLARIPEKTVSAKAVDKICDMEGIDKKNLKTVIRKLSPVVSNG